ncbi:MAG: helix-turn-helix domain-containing protein [bacterium]|nr:helix-turn-helix domain-containing protein [bacterium]
MTNKSYHQYCAIAHALDTVGDRWTLLIVRNLLFAPKRFVDLMRGLPGISTNILTERLKLLEERAVVTTRYLPPPAATSVYTLTEKGGALADVLAALARWGSLTLGDPQADQFFVTEAISFMIVGMFRRQRPFPGHLSINILVQDTLYSHSFSVMLGTDGISMAETPVDHADLTLILPLATLALLSSQRARIRDALAENGVRAEGVPAALQAVITWVDS